MGERQMLPWQMNSMFIIVLFLLDFLGNALFCEGNSMVSWFMVSVDRNRGKF
jgi:hypothetical protein